MLPSKIWLIALLCTHVAIWIPCSSIRAGVVYTTIDLQPAGFGLTEAGGVEDGQQVGDGGVAGQTHALLWSGSAQSAIDLNPPGFTYSTALKISGGLEVGQGLGPVTGSAYHAMLWSGSLNSFVDLNLPGLTSSLAFDISGQQVVGSGTTSPSQVMRHAILWDLSAHTFVDLNPPGFVESEAAATDGSRQVGFGSGPSTDGIRHALIWRGVADGVIDLNPPGFSTSIANSIADRQEIGYGYLIGGGDSHALLWNGSAASGIDLNPPGFTFSYGFGVANGQQVGAGEGPETNNQMHALLWSGSAQSVVDLQQFLPPQFDASSASAIDAQGDIVGFAAGPTGTQAVEWISTSSVPLPVAALPGLAMIAMLSALSARVRRRYSALGSRHLFGLVRRAARRSIVRRHCSCIPRPTEGPASRHGRAGRYLSFPAPDVACFTRVALVGHSRTSEVGLRTLYTPDLIGSFSYATGLHACLRNRFIVRHVRKCLDSRHEDTMKLLQFFAKPFVLPRPIIAVSWIGTLVEQSPKREIGDAVGEFIRTAG